MGEPSTHSVEPPILVESVESVNIVRYRGKYFCAPHALGPLDLQQLDPRTISGVLIANTLCDARRLAGCAAMASPAKVMAPPILAGTDANTRGEAACPVEKALRSPPEPVPKPVFTGEYPSFSPADRLTLARLIRTAKRPGCRMAEIGSWLGTGSTRVFQDELRDCPGSRLLCVDTWQGSANVDHHRDFLAHYDVFGTFRRNVEEARSIVDVQALMSSSVAAAALIADRVFDLVFIDADHGYRSVAADIAAWRPKIRPGGLLCGHDCETRLTSANRAKIEANCDRDAITGDGTRFAAIHPGSILAVHEAFEGTAALCADEPLLLPDGTSGFSTIWFVQI